MTSELFGIIINILQKHIPNITNQEELWLNGSQLLFDFCDEHMFVGEIINGPVMYRLNTGLAMQTNQNEETLKNIYKLAPFLKDNAHDASFMEQYALMNNTKDVQHILPSIAIKNALRTGITSEEVNKAHNIENREIVNKKGVTKDD